MEGGGSRSCTDRYARNLVLELVSKNQPGLQRSDSLKQAKLCWLVGTTSI